MFEKKNMSLLNKKKKPCFFHNFSDFSISYKTLDILNRLGYKKPTIIQRKSLPYTLLGRDTMVSAKTGSGKTLCFLIPIIERLLSKNWSNNDTIGACIICPIRELAIQIFSICNDITLVHPLKTSIIIGGIKKFTNTNSAIVCTTIGRLCAEIFMGHNSFLNSLQILTVDEIDQILDLGFKRSFLEIYKHIPKKKQTLLFSATLNTRIKDMVSLNLNNPIFLCCGKNIKNKNRNQLKNFYIVPKNIHQYCCFIDADQKTNFIFSFFLSHPKDKIIVVFSTNKQVSFFFGIFRKLKPNLSVYQLYGGMKQLERTTNYISFNQLQSGILLATDIVSRGLDIKGVDWVIQFDCPHSIKVYLHRIGRTGRLSEMGRSLILLTKYEYFFFSQLKKFNISIIKIKPRETQLIKINSKIKNLLNQEKKFYFKAYDAYINYARYIFSVQFKQNPDFTKIEWKKLGLNYGIYR